MKYMVSWTWKAGGSGTENEETLKRALAVFSKWSPPEDSTFLQFLNRLDGGGGYAVVETDSPTALAEGPAKFGTYLDYQIVPVMDMMESIPTINEGAEFRDSIN
jgi:hypothetical protein